MPLELVKRIVREHCGTPRDVLLEDLTPMQTRALRQAGFDEGELRASKCLVTSFNFETELQKAAARASASEHSGRIARGNIATIIDDSKKGELLLAFFGRPAKLASAHGFLKALRDSRN